VLCALAQVSDTGFVRKVGSNCLINVICSESGHLQADWESKIDGKRKYFKRYISKMVYITHHGAIGKDSKGRDLKVDHLDEDPHNNHMDNLRLLTHEVSLLSSLLLHTYRTNSSSCVVLPLQENRRRSTNVNSNNSSGVTGVSYNITTGRWAAYIRVDNRLINLGNFESIEGAAAARDAAERKHKYGKYHDTASTNRDDTSNTEQQAQVWIDNKAYAHQYTIK
jgi:HNH endonuclease/AP2 domain